MKTKSTFFALLVGYTTLCAQNKNGYAPYFSADTTAQKTAADLCKTSIISEFVVPTDFNKESKKAFLSVRDDLIKDISGQLRYEAIMDKSIYPYLQTMVKNITSSNKQLGEMRVFLTNAPTANACALGDGTLLVNTGLISRMENESQLAFVVAHELSHNHFKHIQKGLVSRVKLVTSNEFKKAIKKAANEEFNTHKKIDEVLKKTSFKALFHRRSDETQADSFAYVLMQNTAYDSREAARALSLLDSIDMPLTTTDIDFKKYFSCKDYAFDAQKVKKSSSFLSIEKNALELSDSLKSHPDCKKRVAFMRKLMEKNAPKGSKKSGSEGFENIRFLAIHETINGWYLRERYDLALFNALEYLEKYPDNAYMKTVSVLCLQQMYGGLKEHNLAEYVDRREEDYTKKYNDFLDVLNSLRLSEFKNMTTCSVSTIKAVDEEYQMAILYYFSMMNEDKAAAEKAKTTYLAKYKDGRFAEILHKTDAPKKKKR